MGNSGVLRSLFGAILFVGFVWFLFVEIVESGGTEATTTTTSSSTSTTTSSSARTTTTRGNFKRLDVIPRNSPAVNPHLDPNYASKRRVPNGPDPIHNRRAGKSKQPPGKA